METEYGKSEYLKYLGSEMDLIEKKVTELAAHLTMVKYEGEMDYREKVTMRTFEAFEEIKELKYNYDLLEGLIEFIDAAEELY